MIKISRRPAGRNIGRVPAYIMKATVDRVIKDNYSVRTAPDLYGISISTLHAYIKKARTVSEATSMS